LRYYKKVNLGNGKHINVSKSGFSASQTTDSGTISTKGVSIRTGIPGFSYRKSWGKGAGGLVILIILFAFFFWLIKICFRLIYNICVLSYNKINELINR